MTMHDDDRRPGEPASAELAVRRPRPWISRFDELRLDLVGVGDVRPSDRAPAPALEFTFDGEAFLLELRSSGSSRLSHAVVGTVAEFTYTSSITDMRYTLRGWEASRDPLPPRRAVAYMVAMQLCVRAADRLRYADLFG